MKTLEQIRESMIQGGLGDYFNQLAPYARNVIRITPEVCDDGDIPVGASKFGGCPDLPAGMEWFQVQHGSYAAPLYFVAQINFAEIASFDVEHKLPERGMLYFFYDGETDARLNWLPSGNGLTWQIFFCEDESAVLSRCDSPANMEENEFSQPFGAARLQFESELEMPPEGSDLIRDKEFFADTDVFYRYAEWVSGVSRECHSQLFGHAKLNMFNGMERDCECVRQKIPCTIDGEKSIAYEDLLHWNLLLQVDSNEEMDMYWGDMGWLCLWITSEDLRARRFDKCLVMHESC